jgi:hypothetical protein
MFSKLVLTNLFRVGDKKVEFDAKTVYSIPEVKMSVAECGVVNISETSAKFAVYQRDGKLSRFVTAHLIDSSRLLVTGTDFQEFRDHTFHDQYTFPSDIVPDMLKASKRFMYTENVLTTAVATEGRIDGNKLAFHNLNCKVYYEWIAGVDKFMGFMHGKIVNHGKIAWKVDKNFKATLVSDVSAKPKQYNLRVLYSPRKEDFILLGFNGQSVTVDATAPIVQKSFNVDAKSLWYHPSKLDRKDELFYFDFKRIQGSTKPSKTGVTQSAVAELWYLPDGFGADYGMQKFYYIEEDAEKLTITGSPQIKPAYNYQYMVTSRIGQFTDRFSPEMKDLRFSHGSLSSQIYKGDVKFDQPLTTEALIKTMDRYYALIGATCEVKKNEYYLVAPDFHLVSYEGLRKQTKMTIMKKTNTVSLDGCLNLVIPK